MTFSVVIGTFGDKSYWGKIAERAIASCGSDVQTIWVHGNTLAQARNEGARRADGTRLVFLDADDELEPFFFEHVVETEDVLQPMTIYKTPDGKETDAHWISPAPRLIDSNHIVVGAPVDRRLFMDSGGFDEWPMYEDWALWLKLQKMGATFGRTTAAYIVNINPQGRNSGPDAGYIAQRIRATYA